ncbi:MULTISPECIES: MFS transporter [Paraburkholderia]|uniref:Predicted arabinose efflux permease, MFS family n=1 Tax=Paraburkholderia phenazinium TaxID=60549 RepID=A0A1N6K4D3_9BURK|nr:MFS transporter [Paraburkholderia phenazinium]SIO51452.1 Predicted arabinose efflux permease, MFS family [Paraburkholderia phenazinium]
MQQAAMRQATGSRWWRIGGALLTGLFVAYLDRTNLSVALPSVAQDLGFSGARFPLMSSWVLTIFLIGYALANVVGGVATRKLEPKTVVMASFAIWSTATLFAGFANGVAVMLICRLILGIAEGVYWPQMSRFVRDWFAPDELSKANSIIQYYGQYLALATGFLLLTPIYDAFGWRTLFFLTGAIGLVLIVPMYAKCLRPRSEAPFAEPENVAAVVPLTFNAVGGWAFVLLVISYITQGMLFWGITLWVPMAVKSIGFSGVAQALASSVPFVAAILFAIPMSMISDRTNKRVLIAGLGLMIPGAMLLLLPELHSGYAKLGLITLALGLYASSYTPNIWSILQLTARPSAIGSASGIMNGVGAGGGGTIAGFMVGLLYRASGSYMLGFTVLGGIVIFGGIALLASGWIVTHRKPGSSVSLQY